MRPDFESPALAFPAVSEQPCDWTAVGDWDEWSEDEVDSLHRLLRIHRILTSSPSERRRKNKAAPPNPWLLAVLHKPPAGYAPRLLVHS